MHFGQTILGSRNFSYPGFASTKDSAAIFQNSIGVSYANQSGSNDLAVSTLIDTSSIDFSKVQYGYYYGVGLQSKVITSGVPSANHKSSIYSASLYCQLDDNPAAGSTYGPQSAYGVDCGVYTNNSRSMFSMTGINGYAGYYADSGSTGSDPQYAGVFALSFYAQVSGGTHQNLVGTDTAFTIYGNSSIANAYGVRNINEIDTAANINNAYGFYSKYNNYSGQTAIAQNTYGLYIEDVTGLGAVRNYSICSNGGPSYFRDDIRAGAYKLNDVQVAPATSTDTGVKGQIIFAFDAIYFCIDTNRWKRAALTDF